MLWLLIACESERIAALEARQAEMKERIDQLEDEVDALRGERGTAAPEAPAKADSAPEAAPGSPPTAWVSEAAWDALRTAKAEDLGRFVPHRSAAGEPDGYRVSGIQGGSPLDEAGLKNGDVVHAFRACGEEVWTKLPDPAFTPERRRALLDCPAVGVRISRGGQTAEYTFTRGEEARPR